MGKTVSTMSSPWREFYCVCGVHCQHSRRITLSLFSMDAAELTTHCPEVILSLSELLSLRHTWQNGIENPTGGLWGPCFAPVFTAHSLQAKHEGSVTEAENSLADLTAKQETTKQGKRNEVKERPSLCLLNFKVSSGATMRAIMRQEQQDLRLKEATEHAGHSRGVRGQHGGGSTGFSILLSSSVFWRVASCQIVANLRNLAAPQQPNGVNSFVKPRGASPMPLRPTPCGQI